MAATGRTAPKRTGSPALHISAVDSQSGSKHRLIRLTGTFPYDDLIQQPYPLQVFVREAEGEKYVCFSVPWGTMMGKHEAFQDGLQVEDVPLIAANAKPDDGGRILHVGPRLIRVQLPKDFPAGPAEATLFVMYRDEPIFSNTVPFEIEEAKW